MPWVVPWYATKSSNSAETCSFVGSQVWSSVPVPSSVPPFQFLEIFSHLSVLLFSVCHYRVWGVSRESRVEVLQTFFHSAALGFVRQMFLRRDRHSKIPNDESDECDMMFGGITNEIQQIVSVNCISSTLFPYMFCCKKCRRFLNEESSAVHI